MALGGATFAYPYAMTATMRNEAVENQHITGPSSQDFAKSNWLGPPLRTLQGRQFDQACADLMRLADAGFAATLIVGVRTGGLVVAETMARSTSSAVPVM